MSLVHQQVSSYRLVRKLRANQDYKVYQAVHKRSSEKRIIQLAKLEDKLNKKESRTYLLCLVSKVFNQCTSLLQAMMGRRYQATRTPLTLIISMLLFQSRER